MCEGEGLTGHEVLTAAGGGFVHGRLLAHVALKERKDWLMLLIISIHTHKFIDQHCNMSLEETVN